MSTRTRSITWCAVATLLLGAAVIPPAAADDGEEHHPVYTRVALWQVDRADWRAFEEMFETHDKPILEKLFADGMDAVEAAFDADWGGLDEEGRRARWVSIMDTVDEASFRSNMSNIRHYQVKAH